MDKTNIIKEQEWENSFDEKFCGDSNDYYDVDTYDSIKSFIRSNRSQLLQEIEEIERKYDELIFGVARKFEGETRHETALRYIKEAEQVVLESPADATPFLTPSPTVVDSCR